MIWIYGILTVYILMQVASVVILFYRLHREKKIKSSMTTRSVSEDAGISVVTSLKGITDNLELGLLCILKQTYSGPIEFVIAVQDENDPVIPLAKQIIANCDSRVSVKWITGFNLRGVNPRSAKMAEAILHSKYPWIYWHAVDSLVDENHFKECMFIIDGNEKRYVSAFPVNIQPNNFGAKIETVALNLEVTKYFSSAFMDAKAALAYGGALLAHRSLLEQSEALEGTLNRLTDDVILAQGFNRVGGQCKMAAQLAYVIQEKLSFKDFIKRQVRWMMIARHYMRPLFFLSPLFWWGQYFLVASLFAAPTLFLSLAAVVFGIRIVQTLVFQILLKTPPRDWIHSWMIVLYDLIMPICWVSAIFIREVNWSGDVMVLGPNGVLVRGSASGQGDLKLAEG